MSFDAREVSTDSGQPIRCYMFQFGDGSRAFGFTSTTNGMRLIPIAGAIVFMPVAIKDDGLRITGDKIAHNFSITAPADIEPAQWFLRSPPSRTVRLVVYDKHVGDLEFIVSYVGEVTEVSFDNDGQCKFVCGAIGHSMDREGLRLCWQRTCTHTIYDANCKLVPAFFARDAVVTSVGASTVQVDGLSAEPTGKFNGGFVQFQHPIKGSLYRTVRKSTPTSLEIFEGTSDLFPGTTVKVYPGCDHTPSTCQSFGNYTNYGGIPSLPGKSPFDGNPVF